MPELNEGWVFSDSPNTACYTTRFVLDGNPVVRVYHDYDGAWQFHGAAGGEEALKHAELVCLEHVINRDPSLLELHDLPHGWCASRGGLSDDWVRFKNNPYPSFVDDGYYLEDAHGLAKYWAELNPPALKVRENLRSGQIVKLVFRFAREESERQDDECERMWVQVQGVDGNGFYFGALDNDPHHDAVKAGDRINFGPLHIADISLED